MDWYEETLQLLDDRLKSDKGESVTDISLAAGLKPRWVYKILAGKTTHPSIHMIQQLHKYLNHD